jgi:hypothetical protein
VLSGTGVARVVGGNQPSNGTWNLAFHEFPLTTRSVSRTRTIERNFCESRRAPFCFLDQRKIRSLPMAAPCFCGFLSINTSHAFQTRHNHSVSQCGGTVPFSTLESERMVICDQENDGIDVENVGNCGIEASQGTPVCAKGTRAMMKRFLLYSSFKRPRTASNHLPSLDE